MEDRNQRSRKQGNPLREWISDNLRYIVLILLLAAIILGVVFVIKALRQRGSDRTNPQTSEISVSAVSASSAETSASSAVQATETDDFSTSGEEIDKTPIYTLTEADVDVTEAVRESFRQLQESEQNDLIESYDQFSVFTSPGVGEGEYVAFASYRYKYMDFAESLPGLSSLYLATGSDGTLYEVENPDADQQALMENVIAGADVQALMSNLQAEYDETLAGNAELAAFVDRLDG